MNCKFCGTENPDNAKYCFQCGKPFPAESEKCAPEAVGVNPEAEQAKPEELEPANSELGPEADSAMPIAETSKLGTSGAQPETEQPETGSPQPKKENAKCNVLSIVGLIMALVSLGLSFLPFQIIVSLAAFVICIIAMVQIKIRKEQGADLALAGLIVAFVSIAINLLICLVLYIRILNINAIIEWLSQSDFLEFLDDSLINSLKGTNI